ARLERGVVFGDEGIGFVVGAAPAGEFAAELVRQIRPVIRWELEHGVLLVSGIIHPERKSQSVGIQYRWDCQLILPKWKPITSTWGSRRCSSSKTRRTSRRRFPWC